MEVPVRIRYKALIRQRCRMVSTHKQIAVCSFKITIYEQTAEGIQEKV